MRSIRKKHLLNALMAVIIVAIVFSGFMAVSSLRGWFSGEGALRVADTLGNVRIERKGIAYTLREGAALTGGDCVETLRGSAVTLEIRALGSVVLGENTRISVQTDEDGAVGLEIITGEIFAGVAGENGATLTLGIDGREITARSAVFSLSAPSGSQSIYVYGGSVTVRAEGLAEGTIIAQGQAASLLADGESGTVCASGTLSASALNDFLIGQVRTANDRTELCFTDEELDAVTAARQSELLHLAGGTAAGGVIRIEPTPTGRATDAAQTPEATRPGVTAAGAATAAAQGSPAAQATAAGGASAGPSPAPSVPSATAEAPAPTHTPTTRPVEATEPAVTATPAVTPVVLTCTITIRCDTILDNIDNLTEGKEPYVPASGVILRTSTVEFIQGETVFDVLKRACNTTGIQLEYSWTPMYNSYYIEGINQLYEFDCGAESGWMYKVNGWFPNYGCSAYTLSAGDVIVWCYTCNGLGADVGGSVY